MKKTVLLFLACLFTYGKSHSQPHSISYFNASSSGRAFYHTYAHSIDAILASLDSNQIRAYLDSGLSKPIHRDSVKLCFSHYESQTLINPLNPHDPYDLVDTFILSGDLFTDIQLRMTNNGILQLKGKAGKIFYLSPASLKNIVNPGVIPLLKILSGNSPRNIHELSQEEEYRFRSIQQKLFNLMVEGTTNVYPDHRLNGPLNKESILKKRTIEHTIQLINPENPTDPYDLIDTVIVTFLDTSNIGEIATSGKISASPGKFVWELSALGICYSSTLSALSYVSRPVFWANYSHIRKRMSPSELEFLLIMFNLSFQTRMEQYRPF